MIHEIKKYRTEDGKEFDDYEEALKHYYHLEQNNRDVSLVKLVERMFPQLSPEMRNTIFVTILQNKNELLSELLTYGMPIIDKKIPNYYKIGKCPDCGINLEGVMGYSCSRLGCPTGLGPIASSISVKTTPIKIKVK